MAKTIHVFAAERTPLYLPLFIAIRFSVGRGYRIAVRFPEDKTGDGDMWAVNQLKQKQSDGNGSLCFAICDPTKVVDENGSQHVTILGSMISKAAFWLVGREGCGDCVNAQARVYTYPENMTAFAIAKSIWPEANTQPVAVDHELCHLLVAKDDGDKARALTANLLSAVRFTRDHHHEKLCFLPNGSPAANARYQDYFLTGIIGISEYAERKETKRFLGNLFHGMQIVSRHPAYASQVLAKAFRVSRSEALEVVRLFNAYKIFGTPIPEMRSWRLALETKYRALKNPLGESELDKFARDTFDKFVAASMASRCVRIASRKWLWRYNWIRLDSFLREVDEDIKRRGAMASIARLLAILVLGAVIGAVMDFVVVPLLRPSRGITQSVQRPAVGGREATVPQKQGSKP